MHAPVNLYGTNPILDMASHLDAGLTPALLATSISTAHRFRPTEFPIPPSAAGRRPGSHWNGSRPTLEWSRHTPGSRPAPRTIVAEVRVLAD